MVTLTLVEIQLKFRCMNSNQLSKNEYPAVNAEYVETLQNINLIEELEICVHDFIRFVQNIPMEKFDYRYAEGKWTIKEIIQHIIDAERIFSYRVLRISRNDLIPLAGFDENHYNDNTNANARNLQDLLTELATARQSTIQLFKSLSHEQLQLVGLVSNASISVRAIGFMIIGHQKHHQDVFEQLYL
mgnify:CR=1 FL=1